MHWIWWIDCLRRVSSLETSRSRHPIGWWQPRLRGSRGSLPWQPMGYGVWRQLGKCGRCGCLQSARVHWRYTSGRQRVWVRHWSNLDGRGRLQVSILQWRHNERDGVSHYRRLDGLVCSGTDQTKHQSSASLAFVRGIHRSPVNSPHKWPVTRKCFHLMTSSWTDEWIMHTIHLEVFYQLILSVSFRFTSLL